MIKRVAVLHAHKHLCLLILGLVLTVQSTVVNAVVVLGSGEIKSALAASKDVGFAEHWLSLAGQGDFEALREAVQAATSDSSLNDLVRERALHAFLMGLRKLPPEAVPVALLERLMSYETQVYYWHPESRGNYKLPLFDVARAAEGTLRSTRRKQAANQAAGLLQQNASVFWQALASAKSAPDRQGYLDALRQAPLNVLDVPRATLDKSKLQAVGEAGAILALRLGDVALAEQLIQEADAPVARRVIEVANDRFSAGQAFELLRQAASRPALASAATYKIGELARQSPSARDWLIRHLSEPDKGASAAAALARLDDGALVARLAADLQADFDEVATRHRLLFFHLVGNPAARAVLQQFAADPTRPGHLRAEVRRWLGTQERP